MNTKFQENSNLSSMMIYTGSSYLEAANALANRDYGYFIDDLGYLSLASDKRSYWSYYKTEDLMFADTKTSFNKIKDILTAAYSYQTRYYDNYSSDLNINTIKGDGKSISRYNAKYSYQVDLENNFSNLVEYTAYDLNNFLFAMNYQKYNKMSQYGDNNEITSIRIGAKTFDWHNASDIAYTTVTESQETVSYFFAYMVNEDSTATYFYDKNDPNYDAATATYSYETSYEATVYTYDHYYYGQDNYYAYVRKEYEPILGTLESTIAYQVSLFEDKYGNNEDLYTYYMYDCKVDIPMTLTSISLGTKKSTFEMRYNSEYDHWFETGIPVYFNFDASDRGITMSAYDTGIFGMRTNENENIFDSDVTIEAENIHTFNVENTDDTEYDNETEFTLLSPNNIKTLYFNNPCGILNLTKTGWTTLGNHIESISFDCDEGHDKLDKILGLNDLVNVKNIYIHGFNNLKSTPSISNLNGLEWFDAANSNLQSFKPADGVKLKYVYLPDNESFKTIRLKDVEFVEEDALYITQTALGSLNSVTFDNVTGLDTFEFVTNWNNKLKATDKLVPDSLIHLELNEFTWNRVPVTIMEDIKKFDLTIGNANVTLIGTGNYGMLTREEYITMTKLYGVNAFVANGNEKVFKNLNLNKLVNTLQDWEYTFTLTSTVDTKEYTAKFNYTENFDPLDNTNSIIAVNAIIGKILATPKMRFVHDELDKSIYYKLDAAIDTKDTPASNFAIEAGDIVLYNGDTIKIFVEDISLANNKFNYIKLGKIETGIYNMLSWFDSNDVVEITFTQNERPQTVNAISIYDSFNIETTDITLTEDKAEAIYVDVDNHAATANKIKISATPDLPSQDWSAITITEILKEEDEPEWPKKFAVTIDSTKANIKTFGSKEFSIRVSLDERLHNDFTNTNVDLNNIVYTDINLLALSKYDKTDDVNDGGILVIDDDIASIDENGIMTITSGFAQYDEETETLTLINE